WSQGGEAGSRKRALKGLSRMRGNSHVRFLGGDGPAMACPYPTIEPAQNEARGTFVAPFEGSHGWYWKNENDEPVTVEVAVTGFQPDLHQP
ncbi:hypothetical protein KQW05_30260, partial [Pseudomonas aeruginosa]|nr:hypothetical protein [Pseudomonas aeruginosa]